MMTLTVMPSPATSAAKVLDQAKRDARRVLEIAKFLIGAIAPDVVLVIIRPHLRWRMPGKTRSVIAMSESTMSLKLLAHNCGS